VGCKFPALLLVDYDDVNLEISGKRDGFSLAPVQVHREDIQQGRRRRRGAPYPVLAQGRLNGPQDSGVRMGV